jgi:hypothetical protein
MKLSNKLEKGKKDAFYLLSFEGFEKVSMTSNTKKGKEFCKNVIMIHRLL